MIIIGRFNKSLFKNVRLRYKIMIGFILTTLFEKTLTVAKKN